jgi:hypothetical protein
LASFIKKWFIINVPIAGIFNLEMIIARFVIEQLSISIIQLFKASPSQLLHTIKRISVHNAAARLHSK